MFHVKHFDGKSRISKGGIGDIGEDIAAVYLRKRGFKIIARKFRRKWGELDIVAEKNKSFLFVEVKTIVRPDNPLKDYIRPSDELTRHKLQKTEKAILMYLSERRISPKIQWRADLIAIELKQDYSISSLRHLENIFGG